MSGDHNMKLIASLAQVNEFVMVHGNELHRAIEIHFYVRSMSKGAMQ